MDKRSIKDIMTVDPVCVGPDATLLDVVEIMREARHSCLIIAQDRRPVGIITERDMVKVLAEVLVTCSTRELMVTDFMTSPAVSIGDSASLYEAMVITQTNRIRHLPVVDGEDRIVGLMTQSDIANSHLEAIEKQRDIIEHSISERTRELVEANEALKELTLQDALLGIGDRRSMEVDLQFTHANALRYKRPYSLVLLDVDFFKLYNDHYGHQAGDDALRAVADAIKTTIRSSDRLYRYGGEELLLLLSETTQKEAITVAERAVKRLFDAGIEHCKSPFEVLTMSAGLAGQSPDDSSESWQDLVARADKLLYQAKDSGRNQLARC